MKKIHLKHKYKHKLRDIILLIILLLILTITISFKIIRKKITPQLMEYAENKTTKLATLIITEAIDKEVFSNINTDDLFIIEKDQNDIIKTIDFNSIKINKLTNLITLSVEEYLTNIENGNLSKIKKNNTIFKNYKYKDLKRGVVYEIPSFSVFNNPLISNLGPKVPVRMNLIGDIITDTDTSLNGYGINNAMLKISVIVKVKLKVLLPFSSKEIEVSNNIPIAIKLVQGEVPNYYYSQMNS